MLTRAEKNQVRRDIENDIAELVENAELVPIAPHDDWQEFINAIGMLFENGSGYAIMHPNDYIRLRHECMDKHMNGELSDEDFHIERERHVLKAGCMAMLDDRRICVSRLMKKGHVVVGNSEIKTALVAERTED